MSLILPLSSQTTSDLYLVFLQLLLTLCIHRTYWPGCVFDIVPSKALGSTNWNAAPNYMPLNRLIFPTLKKTGQYQRMSLVICVLTLCIKRIRYSTYNILFEKWKQRYTLWVECHCLWWIAQTYLMATSAKQNQSQFNFDPCHSTTE